MRGRLVHDFLEEHLRSFVLLLLLITIIGAIVGYRYYKHTRDDPEFCLSCHMMQEAFLNWQKSKHRDFTCQVCHSMNIFEQNRMLVAYVAKGMGTVKQKHGRVSPWDACRDCHMTAVAQGSKTLSESYGHAQHVFMNNINCSKCHSGELHAFTPSTQACSGCHADKLIHGMGMQGLSCLNCHSYTEKAPMLISRERCLRCHTELPKKGIMSSLQCFDCHHPHGKIKPSSQDCLKTCHGNESKVGQHGLHMTKADLGCLDCHAAHRWAVGPEEAKRLCTRCHQYKNPDSFIY